MEHVQIGKTGLHVSSFADMTKAEFKDFCKDKVNVDIDAAWTAIQKAKPKKKEKETKKPSN